MDCKSPSGNPENCILGTQSLSPFDDLLKKTEMMSRNFELGSSPLNGLNTSFIGIDKPSLTPFDLNSSDMLARESLGVLSNSALFKDSLTPGLLNISTKEMLDKSLDPRESLGVLNISAMDLGRESVGLFNIQNSFLRRKSIGNEMKEFDLDDFNFDNLENGLGTIKKSSLQTDTLPELVLSTSTTREKINSSSQLGLNNAFLLSHSRIPSAGSTSSTNNGSFYSFFNSKSLEEPSRISPGTSQKDSELGQSALAKTDPFNEAFEIVTNDNNKHSISQILTSPSNRNLFASDVKNRQGRIQSLPAALQDSKFTGIDFEDKVLNANFQDVIICREAKDEKYFDDSVFMEARKVASIIADTSFDNEKSFDSKEHNILDSTPQPEWPTELDSSHGNIEDKVRSPKCDSETILKQVDKMLGMQPVNLEEKLKLKSGSSKSDSLENISHNISKIADTSPGIRAENQSDNFSQNISKISRASQEGSVVNHSYVSNNFSQNLSQLSQSSEKNVPRILQNLSDILNEKESLSQSQKQEGHHMLHRLAVMFGDIDFKSPCSAEDSGHSSVDDQHLEDNKCVNGKNEVEAVEGVVADNCEVVCQALDLSCKSGEINKMLSIPKSTAVARSPANLALKRHLTAPNTSNASIESNASDSNKDTSKVNHSNASGCSNASAKSTSSRHSNISGTLRKTKVGVVATKKGPLRAILPVENMAKEKNISKDTVTQKNVPKDTVTPERRGEGLKFGPSSKKTSTPIQEPKLKPMAASTPTNRQSKDSKEHVVSSPLARPKYTRSFSYQPRASSRSETPEKTKTRDRTSSITKTLINKSEAKIVETKLPRRNSVTEGTLQKDIEGPMRTKRSFSTGKEPKILSALNRVRQNILNSPYYNPRKIDGVGNSDVSAENMKRVETDLKACGQELKRLSMISQPKKVEKENLKP